VLAASSNGAAAEKAIRTASGSKDALWADVTPYESGSDHWIYQEGGFGIPTMYLRDHPDIYIHTTKDLPDNIEPTKIKRSAFIAAASGYYMATMPDRGEALVALAYANAAERLAEDGRRAVAMGAMPAAGAEAANIVGQALAREQRRLRSVSRFLKIDESRYIDRLNASLAETAKGMLRTLMSASELDRFAAAGFRLPPTDTRVPVRNRDVKGPLAPNGEWVVERAGRAASTIAIASAPNSDDVTYEIVNFIDGVRTVGDIRDAVSAEFQPVDLKAVAEYLDVLAKAGAVTYRAADAPRGR
jgi:aminopeptidase YwaD